MDKSDRLFFTSDYTRGAHPRILERLAQTNMCQASGYGTDPICESARNRIRRACNAPQAQVEFLVGGTQTNATVIDAFLRSYQGVIAARTGHISVHEAGAIEAGGHKVLTLPHHEGKLEAGEVREYLRDFEQDESRDHMVMPGMVYISQPTEYGTIYSRKELAELKKVCEDFGLALYADGARLAYALACPENDVSLADLAACCDAFYIGGTKCGALFGEAVVVPDPKRLPKFFTIIKQHGALLAKGWLLGIQFDELFRDDLYLSIGENAIRSADKIRKALTEKGCELAYNAPTNQIFAIMENGKLPALSEHIAFELWEKRDMTHSVVRFATDWASTDEEADRLISCLCP